MFASSEGGNNFDSKEEKEEMIATEVFRMFENQNILNEFRNEMTPRAKIQVISPLPSEGLEAYLTNDSDWSVWEPAAKTRMKISDVVRDSSDISTLAGKNSVLDHMNRIPEEDLATLVKRIHEIEYEVNYKNAGYKRLFLQELKERRDALLQKKGKAHEYYDRVVSGKKWRELSKGEELEGEAKDHAQKWEM